MFGRVLFQSFTILLLASVARSAVAVVFLERVLFLTPGPDVVAVDAELDEASASDAGWLVLAVEPSRALLLPVLVALPLSLDVPGTSPILWFLLRDSSRMSCRVSVGLLP